MKDILILGIGNVILQDEGIGIHTIKYLEKRNPFPENVDLLDGGTGGYFLLNDVVDYKHVILIDATLDENPPGTIRVIKPQYSDDYPNMMSAHEFGLKQMIEAMIFLEKLPNMILVVISVKEIQRVSMSLSSEIANVIPEVVDIIQNLVRNILTNSHAKQKITTNKMGL